jgi:AcrR family transcriptional regulator
MPYKKSDETRKQILDSAKHLFALKGYQATQIADICDELHIARGTVYQYFENKEAIFSTLIKDYFDSMTEAVTDTPVEDLMEQIKTPLTLDGITEALVENTRAFMSHMYRDRDIGRIIFLEGYTHMPQIADMLRVFFETRKQRLLSSIELGMRIGLLRKVNPELIASAMLGSSSRVVIDFIIEGGVANESDLLPIARELVAFQLSGVLAKQ